MAYAVIRSGGKQFRVAEGDVLQVPSLAGNPGDVVSFGEVLLLSGDSVQVGKPTVSGAKVQGEIVNHGRGEKLVVFKFRKRKRSRKKAGHRQNFTAVRITGLQG